MSSPLPESETQELINSTLPFEELGWLNDSNVKFSSVDEEDGKTLHVLKIDDKIHSFYDAETGLKSKQRWVKCLTDLKFHSRLILTTTGKLMVFFSISSKNSDWSAKS